MRADGSRQTRLTYDPAADIRPAWSPDGRRIAFTSDRAGGAARRLPDEGGRRPRHNLTRETPDFDVAPDWQPLRRAGRAWTRTGAHEQAACGLAGGGGGRRQPTAAERPARPGGAPPRSGRPEPSPPGEHLRCGPRRLPPSPGGGGPGVLPTVWQLPKGSDRVVTFRRDRPGDPDRRQQPGERPRWRRGGRDRRDSWRDLGHRPPAQRHVPRRRLPRRSAHRQGTAAPRLHQARAVQLAGAAHRPDVPGRRRQGPLVRRPGGATRLFLGFADGYLYKGNPGWYGNNAGELTVTVDMTSR